MIVTVIKAVPAGDACVLAMAARHEVSVGHARAIGVAPEDSANISVAFVTTFNFPNLKDSRAMKTPYWDVSLVLPHRDYSVGVRIDQTTGAITVRQTEVPSSTAVPCERQ